MMPEAKSWMAGTSPAMTVESLDRESEARFATDWALRMTEATGESDGGTHILRVVALLRDLPERGLVRGQVGAIVEELDDATALVEFSDDQGRAYAIAPCPRDALLPLRTEPLGA